MTVQRTFKCNLCRDVIDADCHGYGIHFRPGGIDLKRLYETEHHLCTDCGAHLMTAFETAEKADAASTFATAECLITEERK